MKTYTIEQIKKYLSKSDSLGDALYFCDEKHLDEAQEEFENLDDEERAKGNIYGAHEMYD